MTRAKRGVSTVVTSVMLVSAVSLMGAFMVSWSSSTFASKQLNISKAVNDRVNQIKESFVVEDVWFFSNSTAKYAKVTVRNTGDISISVSGVYLNNTQAWAGHQAIAKAREKFKGGETLDGSVMSSDAFFPFRDSVDAAAEAGITAIVQPGGSVRDWEAIQACNEHGISMVFTGERCFSHH